MRRVDAVVVGDGIAGSAAAIVLARSGVNVAFVREAGFRGVDLPETLSPAALPLLDKLGIDVKLVDRNFARITSRLSRWGRGPIRRDDMLPRATAPLLLGKSGLRALLWSKLKELDCVELLVKQVEGVDTLGGEMVLRLRAADEPAILGRMIIDATGRSSTVTSRLGVRRRILDSLVSFWIFGAAGNRLQQATICATVRDGWIFCAGAGVGRAAVGFFTTGSHVGQKPTAASIIERACSVADFGEIIESSPEWVGSPVTTR